MPFMKLNILNATEITNEMDKNDSSDFRQLFSSSESAVQKYCGVSIDFELNTSDLFQSTVLP